MKHYFLTTILNGLLLAGFRVGQIGAFVMTESSKQRSSLGQALQNHENEKKALIASVSRRLFLHGSIAAALFVPHVTKASVERRQIELCLVTVQRVLYWAELQALALSTMTDVEQRRKVYLESRLGAKAILTGKISGSGVSGKVYTLASLKLSDCLTDLEWHAMKQKNSQQVTQWKNSFREGLASIVEFDGMDTLVDPSPRSTLTLAQYNDSKNNYVKRSLEELIIPAGNQLMHAFGNEPLAKALSYIQSYYADEIVPVNRNGF
jgi:hypothetical protein